MNEKIVRKNTAKIIIVAVFVFFLVVSHQSNAGQVHRANQDYFDGADDEESKFTIKRAKQEINRIRKGEFLIKFVDSEDNPINGEVTIDLVRHRFPFGAAFTPTAKLSDNHPAKSTAIEVCEELFSRLTVTNFWGWTQAKRGGPHNFKYSKAQLTYATEKKFDVRLHTLIYIRENMAPHWAKEIKNSNEWWHLIEDRIKAVANEFGNRFAVIDVINEIMYHNKWRKKNIANFPNQRNPEVVYRIFKIARKYFPNTDLIILDHFLPTMYSDNRRFKAYYEFNKRLIEQGTPYDGIGFQGHFYTSKSSFQEGSVFYGPDTFRMKEIEKALDHLSGLGKPIHITEFNPPSRNKKRTGIQARLSDNEVASWTENFYTLAFSKPYVKEIVWWFLVDGVGGRGLDAGLVDKAGKRKPTYFALRKLLKETWSTKWQGNLVDGKAKFRGFYGRYKAKIKENEIYFDLIQEGELKIRVSKY
jgi:GH35 family endo-1,4-beta-xylanase